MFFISKMALGRSSHRRGCAPSGCKTFQQFFPARGLPPPGLGTKPPPPSGHQGFTGVGKTNTRQGQSVTVNRLITINEAEELNAKDSLNLTAREKEVFTMLLAGKAPKEIAYTLKISYDTVLFHQKNLYRKLGIQSRAELFAKYAVHAGQ